MNVLLSAAVAKTLLHSIWEGAAIALVLAVVLWMVRSPRVRYAAGCVAMAALLTSFMTTFLRVAPRPAVPVRTAAAVQMVASPAIVDAAPVVAPRTDFVNWIAPLWMTGVFLFYLRASVAWVAERRLRRSGICLAPELWRARLDELRGRARLAKPVLLLESSLAEMPMVVGYLRPVVLAPVGLLTAMPVTQVEAILLHELAHIRRHDYLVNLIQVCLEGLLFYHPAVWWISGVMRTERENCCDDAAVALGGGAYEYATALEALERRRTGVTLALAATDGNLVKRIGRLLGKPEKRTSLPGPILAAVIPGIVSVVAMIALQPVKPALAQVRRTVVPIAAPLPEKQVVIAQALPKRAVQPPSPAVSDGERRIAVGDVLVFSVLEQPEMSKSVTVSRDGMIVFPFLGSLRAADRTRGELEREITDSLVRKNILYHPAVQVGIGEAPVREVVVSGSVKNPGPFVISEAISVLDALARAGWVTDEGGSGILVSRRTGEAEETTIERLQLNPNAIPALTGGETITVSSAAKIYVTGDVAHPGSMRLRGSLNATLLRALEEVGISQTNDQETVYIYRVSRYQQRSEIRVSLDAIRKHEAEDVALVADDIVLVPRNTSAPIDRIMDAAQRFRALGGMR